MTAESITAAFSGDEVWRSAKAKLQRRDRYGRFAEMGGGFSFSLKLGNGEMRRVSGKIVGQSGDEDLDVEISGNDTLPDDVYSIPSTKGEAVKAILSEDSLKDVKKEKTKKVSDDVFVDVLDLKVAKKKRQKKQKQEQEQSSTPISKNPFKRGSSRTSKVAVKNPNDAKLALADENGMLEQRSVPKGSLAVDPATGEKIKISSQKIANDFVKNGGALNEVPDDYVVKAIEVNAAPRGRFNVIGEGGGVNGMTRMIDTSTGAYIGMKYESGESSSFTAPEPDHTPVLYKEALNEMFSEIVAESIGYEPMPMRLVKSKKGKGVSLITELAQNRWGKIESPMNPDTWDQIDGSVLADMPSYAKMMSFDFLIGNVDRHIGNYVLKKRSDGTYEIIPIDHSLTMFQHSAKDNQFRAIYREELTALDNKIVQDEQKYEEFIDILGDVMEDIRNASVPMLKTKLNQILDHLELMFPNEELYKKAHRDVEVARMLGTVQRRIEFLNSLSPEEVFKELSGKTPKFERTDQ